MKVCESCRAEQPVNLNLFHGRQHAQDFYQCGQELVGSAGG